MKSGSLERARTANMSLSKKRPTWDGPKCKGPCCHTGKCSPMSFQLTVSPGSDRSTSPLLSTQPSPANWMLLNQRGNFRYSQHGFGGASSAPALPTTSLCSFWKEKKKSTRMREHQTILKMKLLCKAAFHIQSHPQEKGKLLTWPWSQRHE